MKNLSEVFKELNNKSNLFERIFYHNGYLDAIKNNLLTYHITQEQLDDCLENYNLNYIDKFALTNECFSYDKYQCLLYESLFKPFTPKEVKIKDYVYRLVSKRTYDISMKKGLIPRKTTMQPGVEIPRRIYCLTKNISEKELINLAKTLDTLSKDRPNNVLIKIDVAKFNEEHNSNLRFFEDPDCSGDCTIFTKEPIPAKYICLEKELKY